jgi:Carboxypeptidase regulatory-like domain
MKYQEKFILISMIAVSLLINFQNVFAQQTGNLKGQILDLVESGVPGAKVTVALNSQKYETETDKDGKYELQLPEGTYNIVVRANGFLPSRRRQLIIIANQITETNITLFITRGINDHPSISSEPDEKTKKDPDKP